MKIMKTLRKIAKPFGPKAFRNRGRMIADLNWKGFLQWLALAAFLLVLGFVVSLLINQGNLRDTILFSGILFQLAGLGTVVKGLLEARKLFKKRLLRLSMRQWIYWFLSGTRTYSGSVNLTACGIFTAAPELGSPQLSTGKPSLEDRIKNLETRLDQIQKNNAAEIDALKEKIGHVATAEQATREQQVNDLDERLEAAVIGGIRLEVAGVAYLFLGIVMSSAPMELANLITAP
jgi:hypothetical protein